MPEELKLRSTRQSAAVLLTAWLALKVLEVGPPASTKLLALPESSLDDHGVFVLSLAGKPIGTEEFQVISSRDKVEAKAQIRIRLTDRGKTVELTAAPDLVLNDRLEPVTYTWNQKGSQASALSIDFRSSPAKCVYRTVTGSEDRRDFQLSKDVVVLDAANVIHHYQILLDRYRRTAGGEQSFPAFIPQEAWPTVLTVEDRGAEPISLEGRTEHLRHLVVKTEQSPIDLWTDDEGHLWRLFNAETQFEAVRTR